MSTLAQAFAVPRAEIGDEPFLIAGFRQLLQVDGRVERALRGVIDDVLDHPGSLVRAKLAYRLERAHGIAPEAARELAIAIEYFHTASLIFDDMPAMDDARERRGHPCPHVLYGEAAATLGALALINRGYALLWKTIGGLETKRRDAAAELVSTCLGLDGVLNGQALDLNFSDDDGDEEARILAVAEGKTVSLIRLTLILPALVAGVDAAKIVRLERLATVWGLGYQIADDFKDFLMSREETGKSTARDAVLGRPNLPLHLGPRQAFARLTAFLAEGRDIVEELAEDPRLDQLRPIQELLEEELRKIAARQGELATPRLSLVDRGCRTPDYRAVRP